MFVMEFFHAVEILRKSYSRISTGSINKIGSRIQVGSFTELDCQTSLIRKELVFADRKIKDKSPKCVEINSP
jgi:hypothetical protein